MTEPAADPLGQYDPSIWLADLRSGFSLERFGSLLTTEIGKQIDMMFRNAGLQLAEVEGLDWSPEATADRILEMMRDLFEIWQNGQSELNAEIIAERFEGVVRLAVAQGVDATFTLLDSIGFSDETTAITRQTVAVLQKKLNAYFDELVESGGATHISA